MRIVIDLQGAQTESRFRGVGRYTLAIAKAMCQRAGQHQFIVLLNGALPDAIPQLRAELAGLVAPNDFVVFSALSESRRERPENQWRQRASALLREFVLAGLEADAVFVPGFFEGYVDDAAVSAGALFPVPVVATLHDLIPLLNPERYLEPYPVFKLFYQDKIAQLRSVAALAAVSQSAAEEGIGQLGFDPRRIANTSEAADQLFCPLDLSGEERASLRSRYGVTKPFVLYTGGGDPRKNLERLVQAFAQLPTELREQHQLLVVGRMGDGERATLNLLAAQHHLPGSDLVFAGYVPDEDLVRLYNDCAVFVMPSLHEGFGLPALEAMQSGAPTVGAMASSLPEVIGLDEALFDPLSVQAMRDMISGVLSDAGFRSRLVEHGLEQARRFSWDGAAERTIALIEGAVPAAARTRDWGQWRVYAEEIEGTLLQEIARGAGGAEEADLDAVAQAIADNRKMLDGRKRGGPLPGQQRWRLEGPFDSSYSLALVNRELARALIDAGHDVVLHSAEGGGSYPAPTELLASEPELAKRFVEGAGDPQEIVSRNLFPPRVSDSHGRLNLLHNYAWEETGFPQDWVDQFNDYLQGLTVTSEHVRKVLVDNGVAVPIAVVGNGVDHWERIVAEPLALEAKRFRFLHVSSGFPRKGLDALLAAYAEAFTAADDVSLVIKTFPNPHNDVEAQIAGLREGHPQLGHIVVLQEDLAPGQLKGLYEQCHMLVAPSRAEGFGLPIAEAVLSGLPVLATGWSGQIDFLRDDPLSLVDFTFARAQSHLPVFDSVWADPIVGDLASKMRRAVSEGEDSRRVRVAALREKLVDYTWKAVAQRSVAAAEEFAAAPIPQAATVAWVSTFAAHCGIATYSQHLIDALNVPVEILAAFDATAVGAEGYNVQRCWSQGDADLGRLTAKLLESHAEAVVVQFNYGFFHFPAFKALLRNIHASGRTLVVMLHSTRDPAHDTSKRLQDLAEELALCDRLLVHSVADLNRLKALGLVDNVALFPHGVLETAQVVTRPELRRDEPIIASYGFFLPDKGLPELIEAFAVLRERGFKGRLRMVNAQFPAPISASLILEARRLIQARGLQSHVELHTDFLSDEQSLALLVPARLVVYPYQATAESASGAVRYGLASRLPVVTSPLPIFDDVRDAVFPLPGTSPQDIAQGIGDVLQQLERNDPRAQQVLDRAEAWRENHVYARLGRRLGNLVNALVRQKRR